MTELISDDVLDAFCVVGTEEEIAAKVNSRFGDVVDRFSIYAIDTVDEELSLRIALQLKSE
jgi:hypothetical protein